MADVDRTLIGVKKVLVDVDCSRLNSKICQTTNILRSRQRKRFSDVERTVICIFCANIERKQELISYSRRHLPSELRISNYADENQITAGSKSTSIVDTISSLQRFVDSEVNEAKHSVLIIEDWCWVQKIWATIG